MFKNRLKNNKGTTLLEGVFAIVIMTFGFLTILHFLQGMIVTTLDSDGQMVGDQLAQKEMEIIMRDKEFKGYNFIVVENYPARPFPNPYNGFARQVTITETEPGLKMVDVEVTWGEIKMHTSKLTSIVAKN